MKKTFAFCEKKHPFFTRQSSILSPFLLLLLFLFFHSGVLLLLIISNRYYPSGILLFSIFMGNFSFGKIRENFEKKEEEREELFFQDIRIWGLLFSYLLNHSLEFVSYNFRPFLFVCVEIFCLFDFENEYLGERILWNRFSLTPHQGKLCPFFSEGLRSFLGYHSFLMPPLKN